MNSINSPLFAAEDHMGGAHLDLNRQLIKHPAATFFARAIGDSMHEAGILNGDLLIVDKSLPALNNSIVIAILNGEFTVKRFKLIAGKGFLYAPNSNNNPIPIHNLAEFQCWGVVTYAIHALCSS